MGKSEPSYWNLEAAFTLCRRSRDVKPCIASPVLPQVPRGAPTRAILRICDPCSVNGFRCGVWGSVVRPALLDGWISRRRRWRQLSELCRRSGGFLAEGDYLQGPVGAARTNQIYVCDNERRVVAVCELKESFRGAQGRTRSSLGGGLWLQAILGLMLAGLGGLGRRQRGTTRGYRRRCDFWRVDWRSACGRSDRGTAWRNRDLRSAQRRNCLRSACGRRDQEGVCLLEEQFDCLQEEPFGELTRAAIWKTFGGSDLKSLRRERFEQSKRKRFEDPKRKPSQNNQVKRSQKIKFRGRIKEDFTHEPGKDHRIRSEGFRERNRGRFH